MYRTEYFDRECRRCKLSTGKAVAGQSSVPLNSILGIIVSDYPGANEEEMNLSLAPDKKKDKSKTSMAAGAYLRLFINHLFSNDLPEYYPIEDYFYFTNAIKCRKREEAVKDVQRKKCKETWLEVELSQLPNQVPILAAGSEAVKALIGLKETINNNRKKLLSYKDHPVIVTYNPINAERGALRMLVEPPDKVKKDLHILYDRRKATKYNISIAAQSKYWKPLLPGMNNYFFLQDLQLFKSQVKNYIKNNL